MRMDKNDRNRKTTRNIFRLFHCHSLWQLFSLGLLFICANIEYIVLCVNVYSKCVRYIQTVFPVLNLRTLCPLPTAHISLPAPTTNTFPSSNVHTLIPAPTNKPELMCLICTHYSMCRRYIHYVMYLRYMHYSLSIMYARFVPILHALFPASTAHTVLPVPTIML